MNFKIEHSDRVIHVVLFFLSFIERGWGVPYEFGYFIVAEPYYIRPPKVLSGLKILQC